MKYEKDLRLIADILDCYRPEEGYDDWFVSFGSLLYIVRDMKHGEDLEQDIDISLFKRNAYEEIRKELLDSGFLFQHHIKHDITGETLNAHFKSPDGLPLDIFVWIEHDGQFWHTYDYYLEKPEDGIPSSYHFKSCPINLLDGTHKIDFNINGDYLRVPKNYGTLLDYWYPNWFVPDKNFGVSKAETIKTLKSCGELC